MLEEIVDFDHINLFHDYITKYSSIFLNFDYVVNFLMILGNLFLLEIVKLTLLKFLIRVVKVWLLLIS